MTHRGSADGRLPVGAVLLAGLILAPAASHAGGAADRPAGVIVEIVVAGENAAEAGVREGDVLLSWERAAAPPAAPRPARGELRTPFDLEDAEVAEAQRGSARLAGTRGGRPIELTLEAARWYLATRPQLSKQELRRYLDARQLICCGGERDRGVLDWLALAREWSAAGDHDRAVWLRWKAGRAFAGGGKLDEAVMVLDEALREAGEAGAATALKPLLLAKAAAYGLQDDLTRQEEVYRQLTALCEQEPEENLWLVKVLLDHGIVATVTVGDHAKGEALFRRAGAIAARIAPAGAFHAAALGDLAIACLRQGDLAEAEAFARRSLAVWRQVDPTGDRDACPLLNLGVILETRGDVAGAEAAIRESLEVAQRVSPCCTDAATALGNLGMLAARRGDLETSEEYLREDLAIRARQSRQGPEFSNALRALGDNALSRDDLAGAERYYRRALEIEQKRSPDSLPVADRLNAVAHVALRRTDLAAAEAGYARALAIGRTLAPGSVEVAESLAGLGQVARLRGDLEAARSLYRESLAIAEKIGPGRGFLADGLHELGLVLWALGDVSGAEDLLRRAIDTFEAQARTLGGSDEVRSLFAAGSGGYYRAYAGLLVQLGRSGDAFDVTERFRARSLLALLAERDLVFSRDIPVELDAERRRTNFAYDRTLEALRSLERGAGGADANRLLGRLRELRERRFEISARVRAVSPRLATLQYPRPLDAAGARAALDPGTVLLSYVTGRDESAVFALGLGADGEPAVSVATILLGAAALETSVEAFRTLIEWQGEGQNGSAEALVSRGRSLYDALVRPVEEVVAGADRIVVIPDGPLHVLPFGALIRSVQDGQPRYLVEWKPVHTVVSATVYAELKRARHPAATPAQPLLVAAFGDPRYAEGRPRRDGEGADGSPATGVTPRARKEATAVPRPAPGNPLRAGLRLDPLPATRREVEAIAGLFAPHAATYLGAEATEERAKSLAGGTSIVHFACHALIDQGSPLDSALALATPEAQQEGRDNGLLQAWELFEQVRLDADLVTLSACESGLGAERGGEGLLGLARAFQYAGARSVLASLWRVRDEAAGELMTRFYRHLKAGATKDAALRAAQIDMIRSAPAAGGVDVAAPINWAGFTLIGDWQ